MHKILKAAALAPMILASFLAGQLRATSIEKMSLEQMTSAARVVVRVRCVANITRWEKGEIWTLTTFRILESWKGSAEGDITVRLLGGRVAGLNSVVAGVPRFASGEEVVLFLESTREGDFSITAWSEGTFRIHRDEQTGISFASQDSAGAVFNPSTRQFEPVGILRMPLEQFQERVRLALQAQPKRRP
ncbi:MAG: hypothetical protein ACRD50_12465 [Candidatus Acidiferrales bacterium]